ncbi:hypothetical protein ACKFKG_33150 [Phormidesmis sp. 146-35]
MPLLEQQNPDGQYCIGQDSGIYWRLTDPLEKGAEDPDWFFVPNVPPTLNGRRAEQEKQRADRLAECLRPLAGNSKRSQGIDPDQSL